MTHRAAGHRKPLDAACDHRALFSLSYLRITQLLREDLARPHPRWFRYRSWFNYVITPQERRQVEDSIEATSTAWAEAIRSVKVPGYRKVRDDYCAAASPLEP